jgi:hypothetical protein
MGVRNTTQSDVYWNGSLVGKITDVTPTVSRDELETTGIGQAAGTVAKGVRTTQLSCTFLYDPDNAAACAMANSIWDDNEALDTLRIVTRRGSTRGDFTMEVLTASLGAPVRARELIACSLSMEVNGDMSGRF